MLHLAMQKFFYFFHTILQHYLELFFLELKNLILSPSVGIVVILDLLYF